jgi:hypothetical protein
MNNASYLEAAIICGLMLTEHKVDFRATEKREELSELVNSVLPLIMHRLEEVGWPFESLDEKRKKELFAGVGNLSAKIPTLCFSEVPEEWNICSLRNTFGEYALVVSQNWLNRNEADRVVYVGHYSPVSKHLHRNLASMMTISLYSDEKSQILFNNIIFPPLLDLFSYIEIRDHLEEIEWRIVGKHGFMGGKNETSKRLELSLDDIEFVFVPDGNEVTRFKSVVSNVALKNNVENIPQVIVFPDTIPN